MASSDLLYPIFVIPWRLSNLHTNNSFLIGGQLGQALCKLVPFFSNVSIVMLTRNLILIAVDRFGAVLFPLRLPLIRAKLCSFFILATWMFAIVFISKDLLAFELVEYPEGARCVRRWKKVLGESSSFASLLLAYNILFNHLMIAYQDSSAHFSCSFQIYFDVTYFIIHSVHYPFTGRKFSHCYDRL